MTHLEIILLVAVGLIVLRISGFYLGRATFSPGWTRFMRYTPYGALTALVISGLTRQTTGSWPVYLVAMLAAIAAVRYTRQMWAGVLVGMGAFWVLLLAI